jgi:tagatose 6-phosphate kinase
MVFRRLSIGAVNRAATTVEGIAGKSVNVAKVLRALGEPVVAVGFLGGTRGEFVRRVLADRGVKLDFVGVQAHTRQCTTILDESDRAHTELVEEGQPVVKPAWAELLRRIRRHMGRCRAVVMSGTIAPGGPRDLYLTCTRLAHRAGAMSVVDAQGPALVHALQGRPALVKPNQAELAATAGRPLRTQAAVISAMRELHELGAERIVVTAGKKPTLAYDGRRVWRIHVPRVEAVNPIGSGDAVTAGLVSRLLRGVDLGEACRWGTAAGAANALTLMAGEVEARAAERLARRVVVEKLKG